MVDVGISIDSGRAFVSDSGIRYTYQPSGNSLTSRNILTGCILASISSFLPSVGPLTGSTEVTLRGTNFFNAPGISCEFFAIGAVPAWWISSSLVVCLSPPSSEPVVQVEFSNNGVDYTGNRLKFHYSLSALPLSLIPSIGLKEGNFFISIVGNNFVNFTTFRCRIDGTYVISSVFNESLALAKLPPRTRLDSLASMNAYEGPDCVRLDCSNNNVEFLPQDGLSFCYFGRLPNNSRSLLTILHRCCTDLEHPTFWRSSCWWN